MKSKKKAFGLSSSLQKGLSDAIAMVENNESIYRNTLVPISRLELDPNNPRKLFISRQEVESGILNKDENLVQKQNEFEKLKELSESIRISGLISPIIAYKHSELYRIVAGERRFLASILAGKTEIDARIFHERPSHLELKLVQWYENTEREDLSLSDRIGNVKEIMNAYLKENPKVKPTGTLLQEITGLSRTQAFSYFALLNAPQDVIDAIDNGIIDNLDKAKLVAGCDDRDARAALIRQCVNGVGEAELRKQLKETSLITKANDVVNPTKTVVAQKNPKINLGQISNKKTLCVLIKAMLKLPEIQMLISDQDGVDWNDLERVEGYFHELIKKIERNSDALQLEG